MVFYYLEFAVLASLASLIPIHRQRMGRIAYTVELWRLYYMYKVFATMSSDELKKQVTIKEIYLS